MRERKETQMGISKAPSLILLFLLTLITQSLSADLIYKGCANQTFSGGGASQQSIAALASALTAQAGAGAGKFYKTTTTAGGQSLFGLYQCRGDLSSPDCAACVARALPMWTALCGPAVAARVQLPGCYALYQAAGFPQVSGTQLLFKTCGSGGAGGGFEVRRDTAFATLQSSAAAGGNAGFYATSYQSVYAMAQCEGDLSVADCGECVSQAVQKSEVECGGAGFGQVYLDKCYISYSNGGSGGSGGGSDGGGSGGGGGGFSLGGGQQTGKTVAIVVGGVAGLGFLLICLLFTRSLFKKKDEY